MDLEVVPGALEQEDEVAESSEGVTLVAAASSSGAAASSSNVGAGTAGADRRKLEAERREKLKRFCGRAFYDPQRMTRLRLAVSKLNVKNNIPLIPKASGKGHWSFGVIYGDISRYVGDARVHYTLGNGFANMRTSPLTVRAARTLNKDAARCWNTKARSTLVTLRTHLALSRLLPPERETRYSTPNLSLLPVCPSGNGRRQYVSFQPRSCIAAVVGHW